jgi:predicted DNA-binding protein
MAKDSGLRIRVERELRDKFLELCRAQDRPAAQVLREFMRGYINDNNSGKEAKEKEG